jgi:hypothetical protein
MLELETLSPIARVEPGGVIEHVENWYLWRDVAPPRDDDDVERDILPKVTSLHGRPSRHGDPPRARP